MAMTTPWYVLLAASLVGGLATSIVNIVLQDRNARRLDRQRATHSEALEQVKAQLTTLTQLNSEGAKKRAEVAAEVLVGMLRMLDGRRRLLDERRMGARHGTSPIPHLIPHSCVTEPDAP